MPSFLVDESRCKRDGICLSECPIHLIELRADSTVPTRVTGADSMCANCGHCVAICPHGAISLSTMPADQCREMREELRISEAQIDQHLRARRATRSYRDRPVEREVLDRLIDVARYAPSGGNGQPVEWLVIYDSALVRRLAQHTADCVRALPEHWVYRRLLEHWEAGEDLAFSCSAPHLIFAHAPKASEALVDCTIALTYLEVAAPAFGLATCWAGFANGSANEWPPMREAMGLPEDHACYGALMIGYPRYKFQRIPLRNAAKVTWL